MAAASEAVGYVGEENTGWLRHLLTAPPPTHNRSGFVRGSTHGKKGGTAWRLFFPGFPVLLCALPTIRKEIEETSPKPSLNIERRVIRGKRERLREGGRKGGLGGGG